ncbi:hypothetical protein [Massilia suwonensis]|uniref:PEP-CTERM protein-sorting domain-containing protein n=1 Tax=Massilia suwonensis TaxID=648895 RepID=A0ABW0MJW1_9BURK
MDRSYPRTYPYSRRLEQRLRFQRRALAGVSIAIAAGALAYAILPEPAPYATLAEFSAMPAVAAAPAPALDATPAARRVYRYSVVPGGALDRAELAQVIRSDRLVAAHYADFDVERAYAATVSAPRAVYVSYRKDGKIYWTKKKVMLQSGETLLTDGRNEMRARCANRISDQPRFPVEQDAPSPETLDLLVKEEPAGDGSSIAFVGMPDFEDDVPGLGRQPHLPSGPANPPPAPTPQPSRPPIAGSPAPGLSWPPMGWFANPGLPPLAVHLPDTQLLASLTPPPLAHWTSVQPDPLLDTGPGDPLPPPLVDPEPFVPRPDPGQPTPPNPALDSPPSDVPEPSSAWLAGAAFLAMLMHSRKRGRPAAGKPG